MKIRFLLSHSLAELLILRFISRSLFGLNTVNNKTSVDFGLPAPQPTPLYAENVLLLMFT